MADAKLNLRCTNCEGRDFYLQDGLYFCEECNVQYANLVEMEYDEHNENYQSQGRIKIGKVKTKEENIKARRLTSFEEYNFFLIGLINEVLDIESAPNFKVTCLQLWISYLQQSEAAFFNKEYVAAPKLFAVYRKADAEILYNKKPKEKKTKRRPKATSDTTIEIESHRSRRREMRKSEKIISQELNESLKSESFNSSVLANLSIDDIISDHENAEVEVEFSAAAVSARNKQKMKENVDAGDPKSLLYTAITRKQRPQILSGATLLYIIYCALNICGSKIQLSDLVRFVREGHLSFYKCKLFLPDDIIEQGVPLSHEQHHSYHMINYELIRTGLSYFTQLIPDLTMSIVRPDLIQLAHRYIEELGLPNEFKTCVQRLMILFPSVMSYNQRTSLIPNFEGRAMAFVLFSLKLLFGIDGYREEEISNASRRINQVMIDKGLENKPIFVYKDWMAFITYRNVILGKFYHSLLFHHSQDTDQPYLAFNSMLNAMNPVPRNMEAQNVTSRNAPRMQSKLNAQEMLSKLIENHEEIEPKCQFTFNSSFTPLRDNFKYILSSEVNIEINKKVAEVDYAVHSIEAFLFPEKLLQNFKNAGLNVKKVKSKFPKSFVLTRPETIHYTQIKDVFELAHDELIEEEYLHDLKERRVLEKKLKAARDKKYHEKWIEKILTLRNQFRIQIRNEKYDRKFNKMKAQTNESSDQPKTFFEPRLLSDSDFSDDDMEIDEISCNASLKSRLDEIFDDSFQSDDELTLVVPDYNLWSRIFSVSEVTPCRHEGELENLPKNFVWLLNTAASILHQHPLTLYYQLICVEHHFLNVYKPVELMDNMILKRKNATKKNLKLESLW